MPRYIAFDVETPNWTNNRMSAIGITVIEDGEIVDSYFSYVNPETYFSRFNIRLTGIDQETVRNAPAFPALWDRIRPVMESGILVAHNAAFDLSVLKDCITSYGILWKPSVRYLCTVRMGRKLLPGMKHGLDAMCEYYGIRLDHHKADSDSNACAEILLRYMEMGADIGSFVRDYDLGNT